MKIFTWYSHSKHSASALINVMLCVMLCSVSETGNGTTLGSRQKCTLVLWTFPKYFLCTLPVSVAGLKVDEHF